MPLLFWTLAALVLYVYAGYPLLLRLAAGLGARRPVATSTVEPTVTLLISAYNEADVIATKLQNSLEIDYPRERLSIVVISDASDDATDEIVRSFAGQGVELLRMGERGGKTVGLNAAVARSTSDVIVFSDANALYMPDALRKLVRNFADANVGAVIGQSTYVEPEAASEESEGLYWKYETGIKRLETAVGSVVGGDGAIYAIRRELYVPMRPDALSDFVNPLQIVRAGHRCVYEFEAMSYEKAAENFEKEFRRKVRIVNRAWRATMSMPGLLNPFRHGFFAVQLFSHKLLRWLMPLFLIALFAVNVALVPAGTFYATTAALQVAFYLLAAIGYLSRRRTHMSFVLYVPFFFCAVNMASLMGIYDAFRGRTYTTWSTVRSVN